MSPDPTDGTDPTHGRGLLDQLPGPFHEVRRQRPVDPLSGTTRRPLATERWLPADRPAPYGTVTARLAPGAERAGLAWRSGDTDLALSWREGELVLEVEDASGRTTHRSRRFAATAAPVELALSLTGTHLTGFALEAGAWVPRARVDLTDRAPGLDPRARGFLAGLECRAGGEVADASAGGFGQLGLRDVRLVTDERGRPVREGDRVWFSATSAGPGFFDTAHTSVWELDTSTYEATHTADLYFERPDVAGVFGDHATHVVRLGTPTDPEPRWLVATSTWGDFTEPTTRAERRRPSTLRITLARTGLDPRHGEHVLPTEELPLPVDAAGSVGTWDPHLVRTDGAWWVGYVSAERFFRFHPVLATGPRLDDLSLSGAALQLRAAEGTTVLPLERGTLVLASEGRDGPRPHRCTYPVMDTSLEVLGRLEAPYPTNIPWPTLVPPVADGDWLMVTFNGRPTGSRLLGYGTHGDLLVLCARQRQGGLAADPPRGSHPAHD